MTNKILVIVESPGKIAKINQYLGENYIVKASYGHVQDLDKNTLSIDVDDNFKPFYNNNTR
jgi:DNA topoisomerase I